MLNRVRARPGGPGAPGQKGLVGNAGVLLGSRLTRAVLGWAGTVLIARSLSLDEFGRFTLVFTVLGLMSIVTDMGVGRLAVRGMLDSDDPGFAGSYLALRTLMGVGGYLVALLVVVAVGYPTEVVQATALAGVVILIATPSSALEVVFQSRLRMGTVAASDTTGMLAQLALTAAIAAAGGSLLLFVLPAVLFEVVVIVWKARVARGLVSLRPRVDVPAWRALLREALPLSVGFGLATLYTRVDSLMLSKLVDFEAVGVYGVSYKFIDVTHSAAVAVTVPLLTLLVRSWPDDLPEFRAAVRRGAMLLALLGGLAATGLVGFAEPLTRLLYGPVYAAGADTTRVLAAAELLTFATTLALCCLVACERHRHYPLVMLAGLVLNVALNLVLIPELSYLGAALATLISNIVVAAVLWRILVSVPGVRPFGLTRLAVLPLAIGGAIGAGALTDLALPWVPAAAVSTAVFLLLTTAAGLTAAAGLHRPAALRRGRA